VVSWPEGWLVMDKEVKELIVPAKPKRGTDLWHINMLCACMDYFSPVQTEYKYLKERVEAHLQNIEQES